MIKSLGRILVAGIGFLGVFSLPAQTFAQAFNPPSTSYAYGPAWQSIGPTVNQTGSYSMSLASGVIGAGASAGAPVYAFRYTGTGVAVIRKVTMSAGDAGTGFAAGVATFQLFAARAFTASDTGGTAATLTTNNGKLRTSFATTGVGQIMIATTAANSAGTRTLDATPLTGVTLGVVVAAGSPVAGSFDLFTTGAANYPAVFATNEGFVIQATVPATGTWSMSVTVEWDEYSQF